MGRKKRLLTKTSSFGKKGIPMKRKILPVIVALILIVLIGGIWLGGKLIERYSYSNERADLDAYYQVSGEQAAIILQDEMVEEKAIIRNGVCYFDLATVHKYFNEIFYADRTENLLLYTTALETFRSVIGESGYASDSDSGDYGYAISFTENDVVYIAADYVKKFTNLSYCIYDRHVQVYTEWGSRQMAEVTRDTSVRERGGIKSPILCDLSQGDRVEVLEEMETWSKVKTEDSVIGYVENKRLSDQTEEQETPVTDYTAPEYTSVSLDRKVSLGWHSIGGTAGNDTLESMVEGTIGMNVIAPTWFSMIDNEGNFRSFASADYVQRAHNMGLQVWGVLDNFNYRNETGAEVDEYQVLSVTSKRQRLVQGITDTAVSLGLDGINIDFEQLGVDCETHYVQFLRELSVLCRANGLVLSVDNYVPFNFNDHYRLDVQGQVVDYVIIMGYDEHWHGSGDPGSVASIDYVSNGIAKTLEEVPPEKVVNALPFYTILWRTEGAEVTDEYITIRNMEDFLSRVNVTPEWNEETCQYYAEWTEGAATYQIWIEDEESIRVKLNVMSAQQIAGVAVWRLGYGTTGVWELINAYVNS